MNKTSKYTGTYCQPAAVTSQFGRVSETWRLNKLKFCLDTRYKRILKSNQVN